VCWALARPPPDRLLVEYLPVPQPDPGDQGGRHGPHIPGGQGAKSLMQTPESPPQNAQSAAPSTLKGSELSVFLSILLCISTRSKISNKLKFYACFSIIFSSCPLSFREPHWAILAVCFSGQASRKWCVCMVFSHISFWQ
jgi:hypothetical protein